MRLKHTELLCALIGVPGLAMQALAATPAAATTGTELEEVVVTAERRSEDIQKVAASVTVRTGEELNQQGRYTTAQILEDIPGFSGGNSNSDNQAGSISIRGIDPGRGAAGGIAPVSPQAGAAVYVDGVYEGIGSGYDIARVEALRGPQGTLYGRSANAGVVGFRTQNPTLDKIGGNAAVELGSYTLKHYTAALNVPLGSQFAVRASGDLYDQQGTYYGSNGDLQKRTNGRVKLLWQPSDTLSILAGAAYEKRDTFTGGTSRTITLPAGVIVTTTNTLSYPLYKNTKQFWAEANWDAGPVTVTYLPSYRAYVQDDQTLAINSGNTGQNRRTITATPKDHFISHELRVASNATGGVTWQAGFSYYRNILSSNALSFYETTAGVRGPTTSDASNARDTLDMGLFAEATIPFNDSLRMTLGVREDKADVVVSASLLNPKFQNCGTTTPPLVGPGGLSPGEFCTGVGTGSGVENPTFARSGLKVSFSNFSYKARLEYDLTPKNMMYAMLSTGFRPGDVGIQPVTGEPNIQGSEILTSMELGSKNRFFSDSLQVNAGVFYYNYHNDGFRLFYIPDTPNTLDPGVPGLFIITNVPLHNYGGELEMTYRLTPNDRFGLNANYTVSKWYDQPAGFAAAQPEKKRALTPYTITGNYNHTFNFSNGSTLSARIDGRYEAAHLSTDLHIDYLRFGLQQYVQLGAHTIGNLSANWSSRGGRYSLNAYVRNFTGVRYTSYGVGTSSIPPANRFNLNWTNPRTFGAEAAIRF
jgi:outer membrane receptor protein involved in Fe transport